MQTIGLESELINHLPFHRSSLFCLCLVEDYCKMAKMRDDSLGKTVYLDEEEMKNVQNGDGPIHIVHLVIEELEKALVELAIGIQRPNEQIDQPPRNNDQHIFFTPPSATSIVMLRLGRGLLHSSN